jgi:molecular chaperone HtpG
VAYRSRKEERRAETAQQGLVVDMVRQFADRYAFVRELVQNGIDAGASRLRVRARHLGGVGMFSVEDDGEGMTRDIIEGPLLTLFNSAKDEDATKIGKYGVGFVSVFAIDPDDVVVETWRREGAFQLTILPDHSYELAVSDARPESGTIVTLQKRMSLEAFDDHQEHIAEALEHWCKHARVPIAWLVDAEGAEPRRIRVDRALSVASSLAVDEKLEDMRIVVGAGGGETHEDAATTSTFAGFYNHGLTLYETSAPFPRLAGVHFKVDSPALSHTLSRDNVRHDDAFSRALHRVHELVDGALRRRAIESLSEAAREPESHEAYPALLSAACTERLGLDADEIVVPLCHPLDGATYTTADELEHGDMALYEDEPSAISAALAAMGRCVLLADWPLAVLETLATKIRCAIHPASAAFTLLTPLPEHGLTGHERALLEAGGRMLREAGERAETLAFATSAGAPLQRASVAVTTIGEPVLLAVGDRSRRWLRRPSSWLLYRDHPMVDAACDVARRNPTAAAHLLVRHLLVELHGEVSRRDNDALLRAAGEGDGA